MQLCCWQPRHHFFSPSQLYLLVQSQLSRQGDPDSPAVLGLARTAPWLGTGMLCPFLLLLSAANPITAISLQQHLWAMFTTLAIILLPGCDKTTLINAFWRNRLLATLEKMLQEADVQAQGGRAERRVLENTR